MVRAAVSSGERVSELCGMQVRVEKSVREITVGDELLEVLDRLWASKSPEDFVFTNRSGRPYRASTSGGSLWKDTQHLGMPFIFHSLQHYLRFVADRPRGVGGRRSPWTRTPTYGWTRRT